VTLKYLAMLLGCGNEWGRTKTGSDVYLVVFCFINIYTLVLQIT